MKCVEFCGGRGCHCEGMGVCHCGGEGVIHEACDTVVGMKVTSG